MKRVDFIKKIKAQAKRNAKLRKDSRYKIVMGFFTQMGFLSTNREFHPVGNQRIHLRDAIWAGQVEPRILEILPAAFARLPKRFKFERDEANSIAEIVRCLRNGDEHGPDFLGVPYDKLKGWYNLPLSDKRTKVPTEKKIARNFRLKPKVIEQLEHLAKVQGMSITALLEKIILKR